LIEFKKNIFVKKKRLERSLVGGVFFLVLFWGGGGVGIIRR